MVREWSVSAAVLVFVACGGHTSNGVQRGSGGKHPSNDDSDLPDAAPPTEAGTHADACSGKACSCMQRSAQECRVEAFGPCPVDWRHICDNVPSRLPPAPYSKALSRCGQFFVMSGVGILDPGLSATYSVAYASTGELLGASIDYMNRGGDGTTTTSSVCESYGPSFSPDDIPPCVLLPCSDFPPGCATMCSDPFGAGD